MAAGARRARSRDVGDFFAAGEESAPAERPECRRTARSAAGSDFRWHAFGRHSSDADRAVSVRGCRSVLQVHASASAEADSTSPQTRARVAWIFCSTRVISSRVADDRVGRRKRGDDVGVAAFEIPEVVQVAVGEDDEAAVLRARVLPGLFLRRERILILGLGLEDDEREAPGVEQEEVDEALAGLLEVVAERVEVGGLDRDAGFETDVGGLVAFGREAPAGCFEQLVDLDSGCGFLIRTLRLLVQR